MANYHNRNRKSSNGLFDALSAIGVILLFAALFGGIGWWVYTAFDIVMTGVDYFVATTLGGPHLHWILLLVAALILAALGWWPFVLFGIWSAIFVCNWAWWSSLLLFAPSLVVVMAIFVAPALLLGVISLFQQLFAILGGRR